MAVDQGRAERFGNYELLLLLAVGGTAEVFLSRTRSDLGFQRILVVKRLLDRLAIKREFVDMFLDEGRLGARLEHPNIVKTLELGEVDGRYYLAMEYLAGLSLSQLARRGLERLPDGLPIPLMVWIVAQSAIGLHYAHGITLEDGTPLNVVHRDVTPQNIIATFEGDVKVVDFGIAHASVREAKTKAGMIKGKFAYMSPEQCLGQPLDRRTDVFALGVITWELVTGHRLFKKETTYKTYQTIVSGAPVPAPSTISPRIDGELDEIILKALRYKAEDRWDSAETFADALMGWLRRRGVRVGQAELAAFFEQSYADEIDEHQKTMSELMAGQVESASVNPWDDEVETQSEEVDGEPGPTVARERSAQPVDREAIMGRVGSGVAPSLPTVLGGAGGNVRAAPRGAAATARRALLKGETSPPLPVLPSSRPNATPAPGMPSVPNVPRTTLRGVNPLQTPRAAPPPMPGQPGPNPNLRPTAPMPVAPRPTTPVAAQRPSTLPPPPSLPPPSASQPVPPEANWDSAPTTNYTGGAWPTNDPSCSATPGPVNAPDQRASTLQTVQAVRPRVGRQTGAPTDPAQSITQPTPPPMQYGDPRQSVTPPHAQTPIPAPQTTPDSAQHGVSRATLSEVYQQVSQRIPVVPEPPHITPFAPGQAPPPVGGQSTVMAPPPRELPLWVYPLVFLVAGAAGVLILKLVDLFS